MNAQQLQSSLTEMAGLPGVVGCALVETETGMVWQSAGDIDDLTVLAEAASDFWRLHQRLQSSFEQLGKLRACVMMHAAGRITLLPCGNGVLLVAVTHEPSGVDWRQWQIKTKRLAAIVDEED